MNPQIYIGQVTGTGAAIDIEIGFVPDHVEVMNATSGRRIDWFANMGAGKGLVDGPSVTTALLSSNGISAYAGSTAKGPGFTIGTDAVNTSTQVIYWKATRNGPGAK